MSDEKTVIEHFEIKEYIPHRHPFLLVDRIIDIEKDKRAVGIKNVTGSEYFFSGHFPDRPVMPGVLIIEALAQCASILCTYSNPSAKGKLIYFAAIDGARFKVPVVPGDTVELRVETIKSRKRFWKVDGKAYVNGKIVCESVLTAMTEG